MQLPKFKYHPDPITTQAIEESDETCDCCEKANGYIYSSTMYSADEIEYICPWCIADGSVAKKFDGAFVDGHPLGVAGIAADIIAEVCKRTPGYNSCQQEVWMGHCNDACEFHGDADVDDLEALNGVQLKHFLKEEMIKIDIWQKILENYEEGGNPAIYKFKCRHCLEEVFTIDYT